MKTFRNKLVLLAALAATTAVAHQDDTDLGRLVLVHPDLGHEGGSALHTKIRDLYTRVSNNVSSRYQEYTGVANSTVTTYTHNMGVPFADLVVILWDDVGAAKTRIVDPVAAGWTIAAGGTPETQVAITAPSSGGPHDFTVEIYEGLKGMAVQSPASVAITGGTIANANIDNYVDVNEETAPATPSSGKIRVYGKSDKKVYKKDSTGLETELGGSSGSGEINVIGNPNEATNWASTGAGVTVVTSTTGTDLPLEGVVATSIKITPVSGTTDYAYYCWTQPASLKNRKLKASQEQRPLSGYASGDLKLDIYTYATAGCGGAATRVALSTDVTAVTSIPNSTGRFTTTFDADSSDYYGIRYTRVSGTTALNIASVIVGPGVQPQGAVIGEWTSFTLGNPTNTTTPTTKAAVFRRVGSSIEVKAAFEFGGVATAAVRFALASVIPNGLTINTAALVNTVTGNSSVGEFSFTDASAGSTSNDFTGTTNWSNGSGELRFITTGDDEMDATSPVTIASGDLVTFNLRLPISEWAGNGTVNVAQNDAQYLADDGTNDVFSPNGEPIPSIAFASGVTTRTITPAGAGVLEDYELEISEATGYPFTKASTSYPFAGSGNNAVSTNFYGVRGRWSSATDYQVQWGNQGTRVELSNQSNGNLAWSTMSSAGGRWRLVRTKPGSAVGFGLASETSSGLVNPYSTNGVVYAGTYTPTISSLVNLSGGTVRQHNFIRVGNIVTVTGAIDTLTVTTTGANTNLRISLPVATANFGSDYEATGVGYAYHNSSNNKEPMYVESIPSSQVAIIAIDSTTIPSSGSSVLFIYSFSYEIQ